MAAQRTWNTDSVQCPPQVRQHLRWMRGRSGRTAIL